MILSEKELKYLRKQKKLLNHGFLNHPIVTSLMIFGYSIALIRLYLNLDQQSKYSGIIEATLYWGCGIILILCLIWMRNKFMRIIEKLYTDKSGQSL
jgi:predicted ATP-grasp superfamily ATP-dependent carboligase